MLYKVNLYDSKEGKIVNDSDIVDYIIVEKTNNAVRDVFFNRKVTTASYDSDIGKHVFDDNQYSIVQQNRYLCKMAPCIRLDDLNEENEIHYNNEKGFNEELTEYINSLDRRYFTIFLNKLDDVLDKTYSKR